LTVGVRLCPRYLLLQFQLSVAVLLEVENVVYRLSSSSLPVGRASTRMKAAASMMVVARDVEKSHDELEQPQNPLSL
jgi:hypothetical protein